MSGDRIADALREATDTERVEIGSGVLNSVASVFEQMFGDRPAVVVADENTFAAAGEPVQRGLQEAGRAIEPFLFPGRPALHADYEHISELAGALSDHEAIPVAVGSGTVNDIAKRASFERGRAYMNVCTAASVDGYTAFGASVTRDGFKQTMECSAPRAVLADLEVLTGAPADMTSAGYADLLAKTPAGADWIVAEVLEVEPIEPRPWSLVQSGLREATGRPRELHAGDRSAMEALIEGLIMSGLAMQAASSSRPASGAEHQFSHLWEMEGLGAAPAGDEPPLSHGFKVGLGTVSIAALYDRLLERDLTQLDTNLVVRTWPSWAEVERRIRGAFPSALAASAAQQSRPKYIEADRLAHRLALVRERWPQLQERLRQQLLPAERLRAQLQAAGCPTTPEEVGLSRDRLRATYRRAQMIRPRYTVLDLLNETGLLDDCVNELFGPGGFWTETSP